jgi:acetyl-CoA carboxylase biotin carboxyl carrier protein
MKLEEVEELLEKFDASTLREFSWTNETDTLSFSKNDTKLAATALAETPLQPVKAEVVRPVSAEKMPEAVIKTDEVKAEGEVVTSPLVGVVYTKPAPDKPDFVKVGDRVKKGQTLLIIEAMKVMNEIPADRDGIITEILVSSDDVVEYGQALVRIK